MSLKLLQNNPRQTFLLLSYKHKTVVIMSIYLKLAANPQMPLEAQMLVTQYRVTKISTDILRLCLVKMSAGNK